MGAKLTTTPIYNEYQNRYNKSVYKISRKWPDIQKKINEKLEFFKIFDNLNESNIRDTFIILEKKEPVPYTTNVFLLSKINSEKNYSKLYLWGIEMKKVFENMLSNIESLSKKVQEIYSFIHKDTYPIIKNIIEILATYINDCHDFATYDKRTYNMDYIKLWNQNEINIINKFNQLCTNIERFSPKQVQVIPGQPSVPIIEKAPPSITIVTSQPQNNFSNKKNKNSNHVMYPPPVSFIPPTPQSYPQAFSNPTTYQSQPYQASTPPFSPYQASPPPFPPYQASPPPFSPYQASPPPFSPYQASPPTFPQYQGAPQPVYHHYRPGPAMISQSEPQSEPVRTSLSQSEPQSEPVRTSLSQSELQSEPVLTSLSQSELQSDPVRTSLSQSEFQSEPVRTSLSQSELQSEPVRTLESVSNQTPLLHSRVNNLGKKRQNGKPKKNNTNTESTNNKYLRGGYGGENNININKKLINIQRALNNIKEL